MKHNYAIVTDNANGVSEADKATASSATSGPATTSEQTRYSYIEPVIDCVFALVFN